MFKSPPVPGGMSMSFKKPGPPPKSVQLDDEDAVSHEEPLPSVMVLSIPNGLVLQYCQQQEDSGGLNRLFVTKLGIYLIFCIPKELDLLVISVPCIAINIT